MKRTTHQKWIAWIGMALVLGLGLLMLSPAMAQEQTRVLQWQTLPEVPRHGNYVGEPGIALEVMTSGFLAAHPDIRWRREGLHDYSNQRYEQALTHFRSAARYADKASQAMIAEMHWMGLGVPPDPVQGYIWMDLAAERVYPNFMILREIYWEALDASQRQAAIEQGQAVYAEFGDDVAKPRLERVLRRERRNVTGSRTGFVGNITIIPNTGPLAGGGLTISGDQFYAAKYWEPAKYWALQDSIWKNPPRPEVEVGTLRQDGVEEDD
ncbi:hypothetical protein [Denitratimonas sp. CY0512]|uniref:hypothetical protein n=1 Tax=Denitratimonas sp. CY0512 TaxID=3131940 RepID=UPI003094EBC8